MHGKHVMTKGAFGRILDKYAVPTGLGNVFFAMFCYSYRYFVPNGTEPGSFTGFGFHARLPFWVLCASVVQIPNPKSEIPNPK